MSGRLSEAAEQEREAGAEDSGRGCWVMESLGILGEAEVKILAVVRLIMERSSGDDDILIIVRGALRV